MATRDRSKGTAPVVADDPPGLRPAEAADADEAIEGDEAVEAGGLAADDLPPEEPEEPEGPVLAQVEAEPEAVEEEPPPAETTSDSVDDPVRQYLREIHRV